MKFQVFVVHCKDQIFIKSVPIGEANQKPS